MNDIISQLSDMKAGQELISEMSVLPLYDEICMVVGAWDKRIPPHFILHRTSD